jgi:ribonuclease T1
VRPRRLRPLVGLVTLAPAGVLLVLLGGTGSTGPSTAVVPEPAPGCTVVSTEVPGAAESGLPVEPLCALPPEAARVWALVVDAAAAP